LQVPKRGVLDNLIYVPVARRPPGSGEVEIRVRASGLNFRDVLNALGMYPGDPGPLGGECAGTIVAVGEGVEGFKVGDEVIALGPACFSTHITTKAEWVAHKPPQSAGLDFEEAATIPIAFLTAYYGLHHLAKLDKGERVLIHSAAGGVGTAAVQLAKRAGAEVFGTASPGKWEFLESLGVDHIMNSRTLEFADQVMEITDGRGVDIVLNSLADDFIPKSLAILSQNGRFLEIGKRGIWSDEKVAEFRSDIKNFIYDLGQVMLDEPELIQAMFRELAAGFEDSSLEPLPLKVFSHQETLAAFRYMAQAKHTGKIVLTQLQIARFTEQRVPPKKKDSEQPVKGEVSDAGSSIPDPDSIEIRSDGSYLTTGGLGALGLRVAQWLGLGACWVVSHTARKRLIGYVGETLFGITAEVRQISLSAGAFDGLGNRLPGGGIEHAQRRENIRLHIVIPIRAADLCHHIGRQRSTIVGVGNHRAGQPHPGRDVFGQRGAQLTHLAGTADKQIHQIVFEPCGMGHEMPQSDGRGEIVRQLEAGEVAVDVSLQIQAPRFDLLHDGNPDQHLTDAADPELRGKGLHRLATREIRHAVTLGSQQTAIFDHCNRCAHRLAGEHRVFQQVADVLFKSAFLRLHSRMRCRHHAQRCQQQNPAP